MFVLPDGISHTSTYISHMFTIYLPYSSQKNHHINHWLVVSTPSKSMKVNWDEELPKIWENKSHVPVTTNQITI